MNDAKSETDLMELFLLIKEKYISIIISMFVILCLTIVFLWGNKNEVVLNYEIKIKKESPSMLINCNDNNSDYFYCRANFIESIIRSNSNKFKINSDERSKTIQLTWEGSAMERLGIDNAFRAISQDISSWYIKDYQSYKSTIIENGNAKNTELYARMVFLINQEPLENDFISINYGYREKYNSFLLVTLSLIIGFILSFSYHALKKIMREH